MKMIFLAAKKEDLDFARRLKETIGADSPNIMEQYVICPDNFKKIQTAGADLVITVNLAGFEFTTLTGGISYNLWDTKFIHLLLERNLPNEKYLQKPLSISMFFYCRGKEYKKYLEKKYPDIPYLEETDCLGDGAGRRAGVVNVRDFLAILYKVSRKCHLKFSIPLTWESEIYFQQLKADLKETDAACGYIDKVINEALAGQEISALLSLIPYIESGRGNRAWEHIGEVRRVLRILQIISLEEKYQMPLFCLGCKSKGELMEKYFVMLFALRRLEFNLSWESVEEGERFLRASGLSPFALYMALQEELLPGGAEYYRKLAGLYEDVWDEGERLLFAELTQVGKDRIDG